MRMFAGLLFLSAIVSSFMEGAYTTSILLCVLIGIIFGNAYGSK